METCAPKQYAETTLNAIRCNLVAFFSFLTRSRIRSLESVAPKTITVFFNELAKTRKKSAGTITGTVSCFFDWLAITGRRKAANPVVSRFHSQRRKKRLPRPYSREEMAQIFSLLEANGDLQLLVAVSLGAEAGLRISECAKVEISEIDLESQQLYVSLPTKVGTDRYAPFADKSKAFIEKWLQERGTLDHDRLLVGPSGAPMQKWTLRLRLNAVLCGPGKLAKFEYHRLRHYASSTMHQGGADDISVMAAFGWHNPSVMAGYTKTLPEQTRAHYDRAMAARDRAPETQTTVKTLDEFFSTSGDTSTNPA
jgi:site-specific recombinase XerD